MNDDELPDRWLVYHCPETGEVTGLGPSAKTLDEVQFKTLTVERCTTCGESHKLEKADLGLGPLSPETEEDDE